MLPSYYEIDYLIGGGGMSSVYRGRDLRFNKVVAIKAILQELEDNDFVLDSLQIEANHYLSLKHPSIVKLHDFIIDEDNHVFVVMEYIDGTPLDKILEQPEPLFDKEILNIFYQVLDAIAYIHQEQKIHLDIKPNNIMVLPDGKIKILDMGISRTIGEANISKVGTPNFMAPEQINQGKLGYHTDIWALGITLFNMVTNKLPFDSETNTEIFDKILNSETPHIKRSFREANIKFQQIIDKALEKESRNRYRSCADFKNDLERVFSNRPETNIINNEAKNLSDQKSKMPRWLSGLIWGIVMYPFFILYSSIRGYLNPFLLLLGIPICLIGGLVISYTRKPKKVKK